MANYLNLTGLQHYDEKIKQFIGSAIATSQDAQNENIGSTYATIGSLNAEMNARSSAYTELDGRLDTIEGTGIGSIKKALEDAKAYADGLVTGGVSETYATKTALNEEVNRAGSAEAALGSSIAKETQDRKDAIAALDATVTSTDGSHVTVKVTEVDGVITAVNVTESDIASAAGLKAVKEDVDAFFAAANIGSAAVDTLKEIQDYISSDASVGSTIAKKIDDLEKKTNPIHIYDFVGSAGIKLTEVGSVLHIEAEKYNFGLNDNKLELKLGSAVVGSVAVNTTIGSAVANSGSLVTEGAVYDFVNSNYVSNSAFAIASATATSALSVANTASTVASTNAAAIDTLTGSLKAAAYKGVETSGSSFTSSNDALPTVQAVVEFVNTNNSAIAESVSVAQSAITDANTRITNLSTTVTNNFNASITSIDDNQGTISYKKGQNGSATTLLTPVGTSEIDALFS